MITIIIPVYNAAAYLVRCLQSVVAQTYSDWECVLVDDGSKDESGAISDNWQVKDSRIRVIHQKNQGASIARQVGIASAQGMYLTFIDADDIVEPDYLESLYNALVDNNVDIAACDFIRHHEDDDVEIDRTPVSRTLEYEELHLCFFKYDFWGFWGKIYKREVFENVYFPQATLSEDYVVMAQLFHKFRRMAFVPIPLYHYIVHDDSLTNQQVCARVIEEYTNTLWVWRFYQQHDTRYVSHAEAQLTESCIKLMRKIREAKQKKFFNKEYIEMQAFLRSHIISIICNQNLLIGLKIMAVWCAF